MRRSFDWSFGTKRVFPSSATFIGAIRVPVRPEIIVAEFLDELRRRLGPAAHAEALATLRRYDQGLLSEKQVARAMDRLFHPSDHELRDAFRYFLPAELAV